MEAVQQYYMPANLAGTTKKTLVQKFVDWCSSQEKNRMLWLALIITGHGCIITPITVMFVMLGGGNSMLLWSFALAAMAMCLVSNLAAMPVKITLPVFLLSLLIDLVVIAICIAGLL